MMAALARLNALRGLVIVHDLVMVAAAWLFAFLLRYDFTPPPEVWELLAWSTPVAVVVFGASFRLARLYAGIWRYASIPDLVRIARAVISGNLIMLALMFLIVRADDMPRSVLFINPLLLGVLLGMPRLFNRFRKMRWDDIRGQESKRAILVIGAGDAAELLIRDSARREATFRVCGLLDDDPKKLGLRIHGVAVLGQISELDAVVRSLAGAAGRPDELVIAIPSATPAQMRRIVQVCELSGLPFRTAPSLDDIVTGRVSVAELREVTIEDILGRASVHMDADAVGQLISGHTVMVTGAGGSIGSELCRQIARFAPQRVVLYELCEYNLYQIDRELARLFPDLERVAVLGDVRDGARVAAVLADQSPHIVMHAAAYKHVPLVEYNAVEGILNNILGTRTVAQACVAGRVPRFVLVSTDKAVNPVNVMGATKRLAEIFCQNLQGTGETSFITVRFGNVLGSVGSVVPLFKEQIRAGGPVTVTDPEMQRYFMTIPEASQLILQAAVLGRGGEIFVLDMGEPVKIVDLATDMIRLSGKEVGRDIDIVFTGLRPGEKLYEELLYDSEELISGGHDKIFLSRQSPAEMPFFDRRVDRLVERCQAQDTAAALDVLAELVPEYRPAQNGARQLTAKAAKAG